MIDSNELAKARDCIRKALENGASQVRASLSKCTQNNITVLDGKIDGISYCADKSIFLNVFVDGKYGCFSTNRMDAPHLSDFVRKAVETVKLLAPDECRRLPDKRRKADGCSDGNELMLYDPAIGETGREERQETALKAATLDNGKILEFTGKENPLGLRIVSRESEYSDCIEDRCIMDSDCFEGRHCESSLAFSTEVTVEDRSGNRYSGYWWDGSVSRDTFRPEGVAAKALELACRKAAPQSIRGGQWNIIVDRCCASRLISPVIDALDGQNLQQHNSFLDACIGSKVFSERFTLMDLACEKGRPGSRLFDSEGVALHSVPIIKNGVICHGFINEYISRKTGWEGTCDSVSRPAPQPFICNSDRKEISLEDIASLCGNGLYITAFNGGNCNVASGAFSFGAEGFVVANGKIGHPFREVLMTGNMKELWNRLIACGSDARHCTRWQIPTIAFENIDINA